MNAELAAYQIQWLEEHRNANEIVCDTRTGQPVKAVYDRLSGKLRTFVAEYSFPPDWWPV